jgi:hypothetical protein
MKKNFHHQKLRRATQLKWIYLDSCASLKTCWSSSDELMNDLSQISQQYKLAVLSNGVRFDLNMLPEVSCRNSQ